VTLANGPDKYASAQWKYNLILWIQWIRQRNI